MAISTDFRNSLYYNSLYEHHIQGNNVIIDPGCPSFYNQQFFRTIKIAKEENCIEGWSSKQWYQYLLDKEVLQTQILDDVDGRVRWEPTKCKVELEFAHFDWDTTWARAHMSGLTNETRTTFWKFFHNLLPTQARLHRITRTTPDPSCISCDTGAIDHAWYHTFLSCPSSKTIMDWLVVTLTMIPIENASIEMAIWLQFSPLTPDNDLLAATWLVGEAMTYSWSRRRNREASSIPSLIAILRIKAFHMSMSRKHCQTGKQLCELLK